MIVTFVHVWIKPGHREEFIKATRKNHEASVKEPGNLRFDFLEDANEPDKFVIYEAYTSDESAANHKKTAHYLEWRETVADMMAKPREGIKHLILAPLDKNRW